MEEKLDFVFKEELDVLKKLALKGDEAEEYTANGCTYPVDYEFGRLEDLAESARECYTRYLVIKESKQIDDFSDTEDMFKFFRSEFKMCIDAITQMIKARVEYSTSSTYRKLVNILENEIEGLEGLTVDLAELMAKRYVNVLQLERFIDDTQDWQNKVRAELFADFRESQLSEAEAK